MTGNGTASTIRLFGKPVIRTLDAVHELRNGRTDHILLYLLLRPDRHNACNLDEITKALRVTLAPETVRDYIKEINRKFKGAIRIKVRSETRYLLHLESISLDLDIVTRAERALDQNPVDRALLELGSEALQHGDLLEQIDPPWFELLEVRAKRLHFRDLQSRIQLLLSPGERAAMAQSQGLRPAPPLELDFQGTWDTTFSYGDTGKPPRRGKAEIHLSHDGHLQVSGRYLRSDQSDRAYANWASLACHAKAGRNNQLVIAYESVRFGMVEGEASFSVHGLEILTVTERDAAGRPVRLQGHFFRFEFPDPGPGQRRIEPGGGESDWRREPLTR